MDRRAERIYLVGFMGCGKTELGRRLAAALGWKRLDTDEAVEQRAGCSVAEFFKRHGEAAFRRAEIDVLRDTVSTTRGVITTGGGLFCGHEARAWIRRHGRSVWLDVPLEEIRRRVGSSPGRPLWNVAQPLEQRALYELRRGAYALADHRVRLASGSDEIDLPGLLERMGLAGR